MLNLINQLNAADFKAFPQKNDPTKVTLSVAGADGVRYFLTRVSAGLNEDGTPKYQWARGAAMRAMGTLPGVLPAAPAGPIASTVPNPVPLPQV